MFFKCGIATSSKCMGGGTKRMGRIKFPCILKRGLACVCLEVFCCTVRKY